MNLILVVPNYTEADKIYPPVQICKLLISLKNIGDQNIC